MPRSGLPSGLLTRQDHRQAIEIGEGVPIDRLVDCEQTGLVAQTLADRDPLFAILGKFRPIRPAPLSRASLASGRWRESSRPDPWWPSGEPPSYSAAKSVPLRNQVVWRCHGRCRVSLPKRQNVGIPEIGPILPTRSSLKRHHRRCVCAGVAQRFRRLRAGGPGKHHDVQRIEHCSK